MTTPLDQTERAAFEAHRLEKTGRKAVTWDEEYKRSGLTQPITDPLLGRYFLREDQACWEAWQAAIASRAAGWISVDERLPSDGQEVIALFWPYNNQQNQRCVMGAFYESDRDVFLTDTDGDDMHRPSHWMARPPTPQDPPTAAKAAKETPQ